MKAALRNIVIIQTDAQHHDWVSWRTPGLRTPNLARLAQRGVVFDQAWTCSGVCVPSRVSLMTGRYSIGHGVISNNIPRRPDTEPWLGRMLRDAGYVTGYFGKTHFAGNDENLDEEGWTHSFTKHDYAAHLEHHGVNAKYPEKKEIDRRPVRYWTIGTSRIPSEHYFENVLGDQAAGFIDRHAPEPFACYVSNVAPHGPFTPPPPYDRMYDPAAMTLRPRRDDELEGKPPQTQRWVRQNQCYLNDDELRTWLAASYGLMSMVDDNIGKVLGALERNRLLDSTLIVFLSDHGDFATRYGVLGKSWTMTEDLLRIPLCISVPGAAPRNTESLVQSIDVTATLLDWAGVDRPARMHGRSLLPLLRGQTQQVRDQVFACDQSEYSEDRLYMSAVRNGRYKFVASTGFAGELYDLQADPLETRNLVHDPAHREVRDQLQQALLQWHLGHSGGFFEPERAAFWEDQTAFYDASRFCGERIHQQHRQGQTM